MAVVAAVNCAQASESYTAHGASEDLRESEV